MESVNLLIRRLEQTLARQESGLMATRQQLEAALAMRKGLYEAAVKVSDQGSKK